MNWILIIAVLKARRKGMLRLVPATGVVRLDCLADKCAKCCRTLGTPLVTKEEAEKIGCENIEGNRYALFIKSQNSICNTSKAST